MEQFRKLQEDGFIVREGVIAGETCYLVFPQAISVKWTPETLIYRSSIWTADGRPVSLSYKKFFNYNEAPHITRDFTDADLQDSALVVEKVDGSTLILSKYKGELIARTRGTFNLLQHETAKELELFKERYPKVFDNELLNGEQHSLIFEWVTPKNRIVVDYGEPDIMLTGIIKHEDYSYFWQDRVRSWAEDLGVDAPYSYQYDKNVEALLAEAKSLIGEEGYCVYFNQDQDIKKVKSDWYKAKHRLKSNCTLEYILDLFLSLGCPSLVKFMQELDDTYDFESMPSAEAFGKTVSNAFNMAMLQIREITALVLPHKDKPRKEAAQAIMAKYANSIKAPLAFCILDGKDPTDKQLKTLITSLL